MIADELHPECIAQSDENRPPAQPDSRPENATAQLEESQPAMQVRPAKSGGDRRKRRQYLRPLFLRQPGQRALCVWPYHESQAGA